ncbi:hypothetical protein [Streptomyces sp. NPDC048603]|uniref:hypothetical protein n=1 Tax=Streptomyces sp. NPDC048603 TaxID=3365577 RepID=UPI00371DD0CF
MTDARGYRYDETFIRELREAVEQGAEQTVWTATALKVVEAVADGVTAAGNLTPPPIGHR